jgi:P27 family predicted phage terminase small subunit
MAERGPKPMSDAQRRLHGDTHKQRYGKRILKFRTLRLRCPEWFNEEQKKQWTRLLRSMRSIGLCDQLYQPVFSIITILLSQIQECGKALNEAGGMFFENRNGRPVIREEHKAYIQATKMLLPYLKQCGMTPASRSRIELPEKSLDEAEDPMLRLLNKKRAEEDLD